MPKKEKILKKGQRTAMLATWATIFLALSKAAAGILSGSILLLADAVHSAVDTMAIFFSWFGLKISQKKYSDKFPYGYFKAENFAALIASLFILYAAYEIFFASYNKLFVPAELSVPVVALAVPLISALVSYFIAVYEDKVGKEIKSQSLIANAQESKIDTISSLVIFGGILLSYFNINYVESVIGMILAFMVAKIGFQNVRIAVYSLMDASLDKNLERNVKKLILNTKNVKKVNRLKLRQSGLFVFGEVAIKIAGNINVKRAHEIAREIEEKVKSKFSEIESLLIHVEPYRAEVLKILIPINDDNGLDSKIIEHFGRAKNFLLVTIKNKKILSFKVKNNIHINEKVRAGLAVAKNGLDENIDIVLTKEIGEISFYALRDNLIDIYLVESDNAKKEINNFLENKLKRLDKPTHLSNKPNK